MTVYPPLGLSPQSFIGFNMDFGRWVEHNHGRSRSKGDNQEQKKSEILWSFFRVCWLRRILQFVVPIMSDLENQLGMKAQQIVFWVWKPKKNRYTKSQSVT